MKPVRLLCYMFLLAYLDLTVHNVQKHSYHFELTDQQKLHIKYYYSVQPVHRCCLLFLFVLFRNISKLVSEVSMRQRARSERKKNKEVFFSSPTTTPLRWVDFEEKIEQAIFGHNLRTKNKGLCTVRQLPTSMFAGFHDQSP